MDGIVEHLEPTEEGDPIVGSEVEALEGREQSSHGDGEQKMKRVRKKMKMEMMQMMKNEDEKEEELMGW